MFRQIEVQNLKNQAGFTLIEMLVVVIILGILAMIVGLQFFSIGLLGELFVTSRHSSGRDQGYSIRKILEDDPDRDDT